MKKFFLALPFLVISFFYAKYEVILLNFVLYLAILYIIKNTKKEKIKLNVYSTRTIIFLLFPIIFFFINSYFHLYSFYSNKIYFQNRDIYSDYLPKDSKKTSNFAISNISLKNNNKTSERRVFIKKDASLESKTIDINLQKSVTKILESHKQVFKKGQVGVMDLKNGSILSLAKYPESLPDSVFSEINVPASTFKVFVSASILDSGVGFPYAECDGFSCKTHSYLKNTGRKIRDIKGQHALTASCNNAFYTYIKFIENSNIKDSNSPISTFYRLSYNFDYLIVPNENAKTDIMNSNFFTNKNESIYKPHIVKMDSINDGLIHLGIGENYVKTNIYHQLQLIGTIANDGYLIKPRLYKNDPISTKSKKVFKRDRTNYILKSWLKSAVNNNTYESTGRAYNTLHNFKYGLISGKTGTSEENGSWFIGYYPENNPEIAFSVFLEDTTSPRTADTITKELITEYHNLKVNKNVKK